MDNWRDQALKRANALDKYFQEQERIRLVAKGFKVATIGDYNKSVGVLQKTYNRLEKEFCKTIMAAFNNGDALHPGVFKNLNRLCMKYGIGKVKML